MGRSDKLIEETGELAVRSDKPGGERDDLMEKIAEPVKDVVELMGKTGELAGKSDKPVEETDKPAEEIVELMGNSDKLGEANGKLVEEIDKPGGKIDKLGEESDKAVEEIVELMGNSDELAGKGDVPPEIIVLFDGGRPFSGIKRAFFAKKRLPEAVGGAISAPKGASKGAKSHSEGKKGRSIVSSEPIWAEPGAVPPNSLLFLPLEA